jgi:hypothetical protein
VQRVLPDAELRNWRLKPALWVLEIEAMHQIRAAFTRIMPRQREPSPRSGNRCSGAAEKADWVEHPRTASE